MRYISESTATYIPFVCGCASMCDSSTPLFIVLNRDNEYLTSYLRLSNLIYDTHSTMPPPEIPMATSLAKSLVDAPHEMDLDLLQGIQISLSFIKLLLT